jgi:hypothetical protein
MDDTAPIPRYLPDCYASEVEVLFGEQHTFWNFACFS